MGLADREAAKSFLEKTVLRQSRHMRMSRVRSGGEVGDFSFSGGFSGRASVPDECQLGWRGWGGGLTCCGGSYIEPDF